MTALFEAGAPDVLYIVDFSGYVFRAYHAITPLSSPSGEPTQAVLGTVNMLELLVRERKPRLLAVAMDSRGNFRKQIYEGYKAHRPAQPEDFASQMRRCRELVDAFNIPCFQEEGLEADDLIAAAVAQARARAMRVVIVSADKDLLQLVGDDVVLWDTMRDKVYGPAEVTERWGIAVPQVRDLLALMGDSSDNIPGVPSVGPKTARDLLLEYGSIDGIYAKLDTIPKKKLRDTLDLHKEQAFLSRELVTLKADAAVTFDPEKLSYGGRDVDALRRIYGELGFLKHLAALDALPVSPVPAGRVEVKQSPSQELVGTYATIVTLEDLRQLLDRARTAGRLALSVELTDENSMRASIVGLSLCVEPGVAAYVPLGHRYVGVPAQLPLRVVLDALAPVLADDAILKAAHDAKALTVVLERHGVKVGRIAFDTMIASYLIDAEASHQLAALAQPLGGLNFVSYETVTRKSRGQQLLFDEVEVPDALSYSAARADAVRRLWDSLGAKLADEQFGRLFDEMEMPLSRVLADLEQRGVLVDTDKLRELGGRIDRELQRLEADAHRAAGKPFNVNSPRQLETLLFDELGLKPMKRTKTSRSTDAATLEALAERHPLPRVILELRQLAKLKGTYIDALPALVHPETRRIHTQWAQAVAATGRISSHDPNLQNIPIRSELGRSIRSAFVAPPGCVLLSADYSQIELRVLAHLSEDPVLIDAFQSRQDIHSRTAMEIFGASESDLTPEMRRRAKAVNFGVIYGQGESGLAKSLGISRAEAGAFIAAYFRRYEGVRRFMGHTLDTARAADSVRSLFGRRRSLPDIRSANRARRLAAERIAMNMPIQSTAADLLKLAMLALSERPTPGTLMILTVHDELVFEVPKDEVERAAAKVREAMENVYPLRVPLVVDVAWGASWSDAH